MGRQQRMEEKQEIEIPQNVCRWLQFIYGYDNIWYYILFQIKYLKLLWFLSSIPFLRYAFQNSVADNIEYYMK